MDIFSLGYGTTASQAYCKLASNFLFKKFIKNYRKSCLTKGLLNAKDVCTTIEFLISKKSNYINGQNLIIDDGWGL